MTDVRRIQSPESTKACPHCGNTHLILLRTLWLKYCADCHTEITWKLEPGQAPLA